MSLLLSGADKFWGWQTKSSENAPKKKKTTKNGAAGDFFFLGWQTKSTETPPKNYKKSGAACENAPKNDKKMAPQAKNFSGVNRSNGYFFRLKKKFPNIPPGTLFGNFLFT